MATDVTASYGGILNAVLVDRYVQVADTSDLAEFEAELSANRPDVVFSTLEYNATEAPLERALLAHDLPGLLSANGGLQAAFFDADVSTLRYSTLATITTMALGVAAVEELESCTSIGWLGLPRSSEAEHTADAERLEAVLTENGATFAGLNTEAEPSSDMWLGGAVPACIISETPVVDLAVQTWGTSVTHIFAGPVDDFETQLKPHVAAELVAYWVRPFMGEGFAHHNEWTQRFNATVGRSARAGGIDGMSFDLAMLWLLSAQFLESVDPVNVMPEVPRTGAFTNTLNAFVFPSLINDALAAAQVGEVLNYEGVTGSLETDQDMVATPTVRDLEVYKLERSDNEVNRTLVTFITM